MNLYPIQVAGGDYTEPAELVVIFIANNPTTTHCVTFGIVDDTALEGDHEFTVTITDVGSFAMIGDPSISTVTIDDNEG